MAASRAIHCGGLLDDRGELVLHVIDDAGANSLLHLLSEDSSLIFIVLVPHLSNLIGCLRILKVLNSPKIEKLL